MATMEDMLDFENILSNERGDELWRFTNGRDGKPQWKVFAIEPADRRTIRDWQYTEKGADYFRGKQYVATDYIIPKKYLKRVAILLHLELKKNKPIPLTEKQRVALGKGREKLKTLKQSQGSLGQ